MSNQRTIARSALGKKQTCRPICSMPAFRGEQIVAEDRYDVRLVPKPKVAGPSTLLLASALLPDTPKIVRRPSVQLVFAVASPARKLSPDGTVEVHY
jgi:hypothetical protein